MRDDTDFLILTIWYITLHTSQTSIHVNSVELSLVGVGQLGKISWEMQCGSLIQARATETFV